MVASILFIFACRYLPILPWVFKITYLTLGGTFKCLSSLSRSLDGEGLTFEYSHRSCGGGW
jgi:hypothetical protein